MAIALTLTHYLLSPSLSKSLSVSTSRKLTLNTQLTRRKTSGNDYAERISVRRVSVVNGDALPAPEETLEKVQEIVPVAASNDITSTIISGLLFLAFITLSVLTIGVVYLAIEDFLRKRETEKFEKAEEEKKKEEMKKKKKRRKRLRNW